MKGGRPGNRSKGNLLGSGMDEERSCYGHYAVQKNGSHYPAALEAKKFVIVITHFKVRAIRALIDEDDSRYEIESVDPIDEAEIWTDLSYIKQFRSNPSIKCEYTQRISEALSRIEVPQQEHEASIETIFRAVDKAVFPHPPLEVAVWGVTIRRWDSYQQAIRRGPRFIPAAQSSVEGLVPIPIPQTETASCCICLQSLVAQSHPVTRLPCQCARLHHLECILQWLQVSHVCPICRYELPTEP